MDIVSKAYRWSALILRTFTSQDVKLLIRAYIVYVRPLLEHNTVIWSPYFVKDIEAIERVQRRFTKRLRGYGNCSYAERLRLLQLHSLEVRRLVIDLVWCYKIAFSCCRHLYGRLLFIYSLHLHAWRGHPYKSYKPHFATTTRTHFLASV